MKNKILKLIKLFGLAVLIITVLGSCATTNSKGNDVFSANNAYDFKLIEPTSHDINLNATTKSQSKAKIKIAFNTKKVKSKGAYHATFINGRLSNTKYSTNPKSPFEDTLEARLFTNGKHSVEYILLPSGSLEKKDALAGVKLNLNVSGSIGKNDLELVNALITEIISAVQKNDEKAFADLFIDKSKVKAITKTITGNSKKDEIAKEAIQELASDEFAKESVKDFKEFQKLIKNNSVETSTLGFKDYGRTELQMGTSAFKATELMIIFSSKKFYLLSTCHILITKDKAYLYDFKSEKQVIPIPR